jgi:hypothetical protein
MSEVRQKLVCAISMPHPHHSRICVVRAHSELLLPVLMPHLESKYGASMLATIVKNRTLEHGSVLTGSNFRRNSECCGIPIGI